jgi:hypothetical protein
MLELRILALAGLIVTAIVATLAVTGIAMLVQQIQRAWHLALDQPAGSSQAGWRPR